MMHERHLEDLADKMRPSLASSMMLWAILAFFVIFLLWAGFARIDRTVHAAGRFIPSSQLQVVSNLEGGVVHAILVKTGQTVAAGAPLIQLDGVQSNADFGSREASLDALQLRVARLEAEVTGREPNFPADVVARMGGQVDVERSLHRSRVAERTSLIAAAAARVAQADRAVTEARATLAARKASEAGARAEVALIRPLVDKGIEPRLSLIQAERSVAVASAESAAASASLARAGAALAEASAAAVQARNDWRMRAVDELATVQANIGAQSKALPALADRMRRTVVTAPMAGRINRVLVATVGGSVRAGEALVEIVPSETGLLVEAWLSPRDVAFVRLGQRAKVDVSAYDSAVYGSLAGTVVTLSPDAVADERTGEFHYLVRVRTKGDALRDDAGRDLPIGPGMTANVALIGDKRSVLSYILTPITRLSQTAFRE